MNVLAIIPARGGSKGVFNKNLVDVAGKPLIAWAIEQALASKLVDEVVVSSDDIDIIHTAIEWGANIVERPSHLAADDSTSEDALIHVLDEERRFNYVPDLVVFLQCTSPIRRPDDIDKAIELFLWSGADSLFSAVDTHRILWDAMSINNGPINRSPDIRRPRQQEHPYRMENGSIYIFRPETLRKFNSRFGKQIVAYPMDYWSQFEIDEPEDLELVRMIMERQVAHV